MMILVWPFAWTTPIRPFSFFNSPIFLMAFRHFAVQNFEFRFIKRPINLIKGTKEKRERKLTNSLVTFFPGMEVTTLRLRRRPRSFEWWQKQLIYFPVGWSFYGNFFPLVLFLWQKPKREHWGNFIRKAVTKGHWHDTGPFREKRCLLLHYTGRFCCSHSGWKYIKKVAFYNVNKTIRTSLPKNNK